ncbi:MAG: hypothetical protein MUF15_15510 [Acidobacteria bacterium]|nr:hypothetical protein [Acidobacteriota bacterium]
MAFYLPQPNELKNYEPAGAPDYVKGDDLFLLINGGAEIYHEYGFKQAVAQTFKKKDGKAGGGFNVEIYEMLEPEAAYGIYTFKTGEKGWALDIGDEGKLEDYYLNMRKGNFLVTITGFDPGEETIAGIIEAARAIALKIKTTGPGTIPSLIRMLPAVYKNHLKPNGIKYLKGNLALFNQYEFDSSNIFGLKEGVMADYGDFRLFLFKYSNAGEGKKWFESGRQNLYQNPRYKFSESRGEGEMGYSCFLTDGKGIPSCIKNNGPYIIIVQGKSEGEAKKIIGTIKE